MLTIHYNGEILKIVASHIYDCFSPLTHALHKLLDKQVEITVTLLGEPIEYDLRFNRIGDVVILAIDEFPDRKRDSFEAKRLLSTSGTYAEICVPFWRALRALQGRLSKDEIETRWKEPFPTQELNLLTASIKQ